MSMNIDWQISGKHLNGKPLTGEEVRELIALNETDWGDEHFEAESEEIADFFTESFGTYERSVEAARQFAERHPDITLEFIYRYETSLYPDGFRTEKGRVRHMTGHVAYTYDDTGEEVKYEDPLDKAIRLIDEYSMWEFSKHADFDDLDDVGLVCTTVGGENGEEESSIQISADLNHSSIVVAKVGLSSGRTAVDTTSFDTLEEMNVEVLEDLSWDNLLCNFDFDWADAD